MNIRTAICSALLVLLASSHAHAVKLHIDMTPARLGDGFAFEMQPLENGKTRFTITRDPSKASQPPDPALTLIRGARLSVYSPSGLIAQCLVAPQRDKSGHVVYEAQIDSAHAKRSRFVFSEIEDHERGDTGYIGGGTIYTFSLIDFIDPKHKEKELKRNLKAANDQLKTELKQVADEFSTRKRRD